MFDGYIARANCIASIDVLAAHPNVRGLVRFPRNWVMYEFHHELFSDPDFLVEGVWREKLEREPAIKNSLIALRSQEREFLSPWYAKKKKIGDADALFISEACTYRVASLSPLRWVEYGLDDGIDSEKEFTISLELSKGQTSVLDALIHDWINAAENEVALIGGVEWTVGSAIIRALRVGTSNIPWIACLWVLSCDRRWQPGVRSITASASSRREPESAGEQPR